MRPADVLALGAAVRVVPSRLARCSDDDEGVVIECGGDHSVTIQNTYLVQMRERRVWCRATELVVAAP